MLQMVCSSSCCCCCCSSSSCCCCYCVGVVVKEGDILKRPKLAKTFDTLAKDGYSYYNGSLALDMIAVHAVVVVVVVVVFIVFKHVKELQQLDPTVILSSGDLLNYSSIARTPVSSWYSG